MSGEGNQYDEPEGAEPAGRASGDVIPVEVVPPDAGSDDRIAALEKEKKENWDRYLRAAADLENFRKR
jgi:molecular chaperone GrpE (heat shock protein)